MFNNKKQIILISIFLVIMLSMVASAHCIWLEVPKRASVGELFQVMAFFGHPDDPIEERDMTELSLYALAPDGSVYPVDLVKEETYQHSSMSLSQEGQWLFVLERQFNRYRLQEIRDYGKSLLWVGEDGAWAHEPIGLSLEIVVESVRERAHGLIELVLSVHYEGESVNEAEIEVFRSLAEDTLLYEEIDHIVSDANGHIIIALAPDAQYVFETDYRLPARDVPGVGPFITEVRFRSTLFLAGN